MEILRKLIDGLPDATINEIRIGMHWTAVVAKTGRVLRCGLASTLHRDNQPENSPALTEELLDILSGRELAARIFSENPTMRSVGMAAINAMVDWNPSAWQNGNVEDLILELGKGKHVAIVGRFPFIPHIREEVGKLSVIEQNPQPGEYAAEEAGMVLPTVDVAAITGMTLINHTLEGLLAVCRPETKIILVGPSTPLSEVMFEAGIDYLSGSVVENIDAVLRGISEGVPFRQLHKLGIRLVTMQKQS